MRAPTFPLFGTAYYPEPWPETEWPRDLAAMKVAGVTAVRWGEFSWSWWEPRPGEFDFAASDRFVAAVGAAGLELILCTPTATPPPWLVEHYPEMLMLDQFGRRHLGARHYGCHHHAGYLALVERIVVRLTERYRDVPHLVGWQIDNEPNIGECNAGNLYDYHPLAIRAWRAWLARRYGDLGALNAAWQADFWSRAAGAWDDLDPPRPKLGVVNQSAWLDWIAFRAEELAGFVAFQRDLLRRHSPDVSVGTNIPDVKPTAMIELGQDYWLQARGLDWAGTDLYAFSKDARYEERYLAYEIDLMRSALTSDGARFVVMETQGGPHNVPWKMGFVGGHFGPDYLERCARIYARGGAEGVCYFLWRPWLTGTECGMNGLVDADGSATERSAALPGIYARTRALMRESDVRPRALLHYSAPSIALCVHNDPERTADRAIPGWHAALAAAGFAIDVVDHRGLAGRRWRGDELLVLPYSTVLDDGEAEAIRALVAAGGRVVAGYATGFFDRHGRIRRERPAGLSEVFGVRQVAFDHLDAAHAWRRGDLAITGNVARLATMKATTVVASDQDQPLVLANGRALTLACDLGSLIWADAPGAAQLSAEVFAAVR